MKSPDPEPGGPGDAKTDYLAGAAMGGSAVAFGELYTRLSPALFAWARLRTRGPLRGRLEPEDVLQAVFCRAQEKLQTFDPARCSFRAWIFSVGKNVLSEEMRRVLRPDAARGGDASSGFAYAERSAQVTSVSRALMRDETLQGFIDRVLKLDEEEVQLLIHCGLEELTTAEAATRLGISPDASKKRWQRLRKRLEDEGVPEALLAEVA